MSKKKKHQKQKNSEARQPQAAPSKPVSRAPDYTQTFDAMFSSALQKMLDDSGNADAHRTEDGAYPVVILPESATSEPQSAEPAAHSHRSGEDDIRMEQALAGFVGEDGAYDEETEAPDEYEPETVPAQPSAPVRPAEQRSETELYEELMQSYSDSPLSGFVASAPSVDTSPYASHEVSREEASFARPYDENSFGDALEDAFGEAFEDAAGEVSAEADDTDRHRDEWHEEHSMGVPEEASVDAFTAAFDGVFEEAFSEPPEETSDDAFEVPDISEAPLEELRSEEPFTIPAPERPNPFLQSFGRDSGEEPAVVFTVPAMPEAESLPEQFSVPKTAESDAPETPEHFTFPEATESEPEEITVKSKSLARDLRRRRRKHADKPVEKSEQMMPEESVVLPMLEAEFDIPTEDTGSLLSVIESLIGDTKDETAQLAQMDTPDPSPTISFTPVRDTASAAPAARQEFATAPLPELGFTLPEPVPELEQSPADFWDEFDELKTLVVDDSPAAPVPQETPAEDRPQNAEQPAPAVKKRGGFGFLGGIFGSRAKKMKNDTPQAADDAAQESTADALPYEPEFTEEDAPAVAVAVPAIEEELPVIEEPVIEEGLPAIEEPVIEEELPVIEEPVIEEELPVIEEPAIEEELPVIEEPVIAEELPVIEEELPAAEEAAIEEEFPVIEATAPAVEEAASEAVPECAAEKPVIIQSAGAREESKTQRPRPNPVAGQPRQKKPTSRPSTAEVDTLRPDEAYHVYGKKLGSTGTRLIVAAFVTLLTVFVTLYASLGWNFLPQALGSSVIAYALLALMLVTAALAYDVFKDAARKLKKLQFTPALLVALTAVAAAIDAVQAASADRVPLCTAVCVLIVFLLWDKYDGIMGILTTLRVVRDAKAPIGIVEVQDIMKGSVGLTRAEGSVDDFMAKYETKAPTAKFAQIYVPIAAAICVAAAAVIAAKNGVPFLWTLTLMLLGSIPPVGILNFGRLFSILAKRLGDSKAALCGWYGAETFGGDHAILVSDEDIFPEGCIKLNGIKFITQNADRVVGYAAATAKAAGIGLYSALDEELRSRNARRYHVDRYRFYEGGGIGAEVAGDIVLMGTLDFMRSMGVHMEGGVRLKQAVYTSVNGELAAVFAIKLTPRDSVRRGLSAIADNRHFKTIFATRNFLLTPKTIGEKYDISLANTAYPSAKERARLSETKLKKDGKQGALLADGEFGAFADAAAGGRVLKSAVRFSILLAILNGLVGAILMAVLTSGGGFESATALNLLLFQIIWSIPTLLLTGWTRRY